MSNYLVIITGHVDERRRPENFAKKVFDYHIINAETVKEVHDTVNNFTISHLRNRGMSVRLDPSKVVDNSVIDTNSMWIPMDMLTHMTVDIKLIVQDVSISETGEITEKNTVQ